MLGQGWLNQNLSTTKSIRGMLNAALRITVINELKTGASKWRTASNLINTIPELNQISPLDLDQALYEVYESKENSLIRFSTLPSKKSLDVLWGHVDRVGKRKVISIYNQLDLSRPFQTENDAEKNAFISYSFNDSEKIVQLAETLESIGVKAWYAEADITNMAHINNSVREAIQALPILITLVTESLLLSRWSLKEIQYAMNNECKVFCILDNIYPEIENVYGYGYGSFRFKLPGKDGYGYIDRDSNVKLVCKDLGIYKSKFSGYDMIISWNDFQRCIQSIISGE